MGINMIWRKVRSIPSRSCGASTHVNTDPEVQEIRAMQEELVYPVISPGPTYMMPGTEIKVDNPMNGLFSWGEFSAALSACRVGSAPGLDGIFNEDVGNLLST